MGKTVSDLQSGITLRNRGNNRFAVNGTLSYVDDYTEFSGDATLQKGNYLVLKINSDDEDDVITVELTNGITRHPVTLDSDRNIVLRITNPSSQVINITMTHTNEDESETVERATLTLTGLTLEEED